MVKNTPFLQPNRLKFKYKSLNGPKKKIQISIGQDEEPSLF